MARVKSGPHTKNRHRKVLRMAKVIMAAVKLLQDRC